jgi:hypothetical protein
MHAILKSRNRVPKIAAAMFPLIAFAGTSRAETFYRRRKIA